MFERYTEGARRSIFYALSEARVFGSPTIDTEHLLLGLVVEDPDLFRRVVAENVNGETFRESLLASSPTREAIPARVDMPLSNECKRVLAYAADEADRRGDRHIRPGHLLLGLLREEGSRAAQLLKDQGADLNTVRLKIAEEPATQETGSGTGRVEFRHAGHPEPPETGQ